MINYTIPGVYEQYAANILFITLLKAHPEYFYDNVNISSVFGNFQFCTWDGGRVFGDGYFWAPKELIEKLKYIYNDVLDVSMRFTFTSPNVSEEECFNRYNNMVLKLCEDNKNEIIINSPILEKYIKENYPKYNFISSTTKCIKDMNLIRDEIKNSSYKLVCLDYNLNKNKDFLLSFTEAEREKVEFLINSICPPGCPNRKNHYELNGLFGKTFGKNYPMRECLVTNSNLYPNNYIHNFTFEEIQEYYDYGFKNFKIEGRNFNEHETVLNLTKHLIKPEYIFSTISYMVEMLKDFDINNYSYKEYSQYYPL